MRQSMNQEMGEIEIFGDSLVKLHKVLKEEDLYRAAHRAERLGEEVNTNPAIIIDFTSVTSIQEDYKRNGTIIIDKKTAVIVIEPMADVLEAWIEVKNRLSQK